MHDTPDKATANHQPENQISETQPKNDAIQSVKEHPGKYLTTLLGIKSDR